MARFIYMHLGDDIPKRIEKEYNKMLRREKYLEERDAEFMAQSTDYDRVLEAIPDPASLPINLLAEENRRRKDARLDYLPIALEKLRLDFPEGYNVIIDYFYCTEKVTLTELATRYGTTIDIVRYKITIAKKKLKEYIKVKGFGGADTECPSSSSFLFIGKGYVELRGRRSFFVHFQAVPFPKAHILLSLSMVSII